MTGQRALEFYITAGIITSLLMRVHAGKKMNIFLWLAWIIIWPLVIIVFLGIWLGDKEL
jgi:hypothetical protein